MRRIRIPTDADTATLTIDGREVRLTNLRKPFWPDLERFLQVTSRAVRPSK